MKISVIICNYNYARYLGAALDSVLAQTYHDYEIIVVDDGSTDESANVLRQYEVKAAGKFKAIFQPNQGQASAFNTGYEAASGDVVAFLDSDDVWMPNKLQRLADVLQDPDIAGVMHQFNHINAEGAIVGAEPTPAKMPSGNLAPLVVATGGTWCFAATSGLSYRRSVLDQVFPIDAKKWALCADGALAYSTAFLGKIQTLNEVLAGYRIHGANNHSYPGWSDERAAKARAGIEMTNAYLNEFLKRIGSCEAVSLSRNLNYRRDCFYARGRWDRSEMTAIVGLIATWPFYTLMEKPKFLMRFLIKSTRFWFRQSPQKNEAQVL